jgi:hypothetical protein
VKTWFQSLLSRPTCTAYAEGLRWTQVLTRLGLAGALLAGKEWIPLFTHVIFCSHKTRFNR